MPDNTYHREFCKSLSPATQTVPDRPLFPYKILLTEAYDAAHSHAKHKHNILLPMPFNMAMFVHADDFV